MLNDDITLKLYNFKSYLPIFVQWDPLNNIPPFPLPNANVADGMLYEVTNDANLIIEDTTLYLKKHDLVVRVNGVWEHVNIFERNKLRFEQWILDRGFSKSRPTYDNEEFVYTNKTIQSKWESWQAALDTTISG